MERKECENRERNVRVEKCKNKTRMYDEGREKRLGKG